MVGSCDVKFPIRLEGLVLTHGQFSSYEPELFPGLIYRMVKPRIVLLIFVSGKVVLTGEHYYPYFTNILRSLFLFFATYTSSNITIKIQRFKSYFSIFSFKYVSCINIYIDISYIF